MLSCRTYIASFRNVIRIINRRNHHTKIICTKIWEEMKLDYLKLSDFSLYD